MTTSNSSGLRYYGTGDEVRLGDFVEVRGWLCLKYRGHVSYIPGISEIHPDLQFDDVRQWAITAENGNVYPILYDPEHFQPPKSIRLVRRGSAEDLRPDDGLK